MSTYKSELPKVFPYCVNLEVAHARLAVDFLMLKSRIDVPKGSSFALTVDSYGETCNLWLSEASYNYLRSLQILNIDKRLTWNRLENPEFNRGFGE